MSEWMFRWAMQGKTIDEIIEGCREPKPTAEHVRDSIMKAQQRLEDTCLRAVMDNAQKGDIPSIEWLAKRGVIKLRKSQ